MPAFVREYGVIIVLMIVALSGYFLMGDRRGDIMDYTLEMLGTRLVELASGEEEKSRVAQQFADFSSRVERNEVAPEVVESVAANILNLRARGAVITPEEAELMLFQEPDVLLPSPPDSSRTKPTRVYSVASSPNQTARMDFQELGQRITVMFELADVFETSGDANIPPIRFTRSDAGIEVVLDPKASPMLESQGFSNLSRELNEKEWVRWQDNLAEHQEREARLLEKQAYRLAQLDSAQAARASTSDLRQLDIVKRIQKLAMMGATTDLDTVVFKQDMEQLMKGFELQFEASFEGDSSFQGVMIITHSDSTSN